MYLRSVCFYDSVWHPWVNRLLLHICLLFILSTAVKQNSYLPCSRMHSFRAFLWCHAVPEWKSKASRMNEKELLKSGRQIDCFSLARMRTLSNHRRSMQSLKNVDYVNMCSSGSGHGQNTFSLRCMRSALPSTPWTDAFHWGDELPLFFFCSGSPRSRRHVHGLAQYSSTCFVVMWPV